MTHPRVTLGECHFAELVDHGRRGRVYFIVQAVQVDREHRVIAKGRLAQRGYVCVHKVGEGYPEAVGHLGGGRRQSGVVFYPRHERAHPEARARREIIQPSEHAAGVEVEPQFLPQLAQRRLQVGLTRIQPPSWQRELSGMAVHGGGSFGEQEAGLAAARAAHQGEDHGGGAQCLALVIGVLEGGQPAANDRAQGRTELEIDGALPGGYAAAWVGL